MSSPSTAKPPIRVGQLWRDRKGRTHRITGVQLTARHRDGTDFPLRFPVTDDKGCSYTLAGTKWERRHSDNDLIELVCEVSSDASEATTPFSFRTAICQVADGTWPDALAAAQAESDAADVFIGPEPYAATTFAEPTTTDANKPPTAYVIAISHGPDVVSRVMSDGSAWYAPTHHGIPTGPWTRYAD